MEFTLTYNQNAVAQAVEQTDLNYCIQGKPGVGKSVLIRHLVENEKKRFTLAAPTGLAALNIGGRTLHSIFRLPVSHGIIHPTFNNFTNDTKALMNIKHNIKALIIDECSMVRADQFDFIDRLMRYAKEDPRPFGGAQVILVGDFYQLPPVVVGEEATQLREAGYTSPFLFSSKVFKAFTMLELTEVLRQKGDPDFINLLHGARSGQVDRTLLAKLNEHVGIADDLRIRLTSTNKIADGINYNELAKLGDVDAVTYSASVFGNWPAYPAAEELELKVGAQIMVKQNGADIPQNAQGKGFVSTIVNGTLGVVKDFHAGDDLVEPHVVITLENGNEAKIYRKRWERKIKVQQAGEWVEQVVASFEQYPLTLAWAISIHKSQGQSFDKVHIDADRIFAAGQLYVALSRCRSMAGVKLEQEIRQRMFFADRDVVEFFETENA